MPSSRQHASIAAPRHHSVRWSCDTNLCTSRSYPPLATLPPTPPLPLPPIMGWCVGPYVARRNSQSTLGPEGADWPKACGLKTLDPLPVAPLPVTSPCDAAPATAFRSYRDCALALIAMDVPTSAADGRQPRGRGPAKATEGKSCAPLLAHTSPRAERSAGSAAPTERRLVRSRTRPTHRARRSLAASAATAMAERLG